MNLTKILLMRSVSIITHIQLSSVTISRLAVMFSNISVANGLPGEILQTTDIPVKLNDPFLRKAYCIVFTLKLL